MNETIPCCSLYVVSMAPSLMLKVPMTPLRVMGMVACVAALCLIFSAMTTSDRKPKLGGSLEQPVQQFKVQYIFNIAIIILMILFLYIPDPAGGY